MNDVVRNVSGETGVSVRVLLTLFGIFVSAMVSVATVGVGGIVTVTRMQNQIANQGKEMQGFMEDITARVEANSVELARRAPIIYGPGDRFTAEEQVQFEVGSEKAIENEMERVLRELFPDRAIDVRIDLPNVYTIKRMMARPD